MIQERRGKKKKRQPRETCLLLLPPPWQKHPNDVVDVVDVVAVVVHRGHLEYDEVVPHSWYHHQWELDRDQGQILSLSRVGGWY